jgi:hypothetical protein
LTSPSSRLAASIGAVSDGERTALENLLGGNRGILDLAAPPITFVSVNAATSLGPAIGAALGCAALLLAVRVVRREHVRHAVWGFLAVAVASTFAAVSGQARDYFLPGILINLGYGAAFALSALVGYPALGLALAPLEGFGDAWRANAPVRRAFSRATWLWTALFLVRAAVQGWFYLADQPGWLAVAKLLTGWPLFIVALSPTLALIRGARTGAPQVE